MKILVFNWQDIKNPLGGGAEVHFHQIFSRIAKMGHQVTLYCSSFDGALKEETIDDIRVIREGGRYLFNFRAPFRYWTQFHKEHYDIVIDDMNKIPFFTPVYVREPLFCIIHHLFDKSIFKEAPFPFALYVFLMEKLGIAVLRAKKIPLFVVSPSTRAEMLSKGFQEKSIYYAYNCVDHNLYRLGVATRSSTPLIGYFGRLKKYKSIDHLLRAFVIVKEKIPNIKLVIIGDGDYRKTLENIAKDIGINESVQFTGYVDENEKVKLLQKVWFMVNTSSKEGWGLTVIESNACGTTVIGSNVPGLRDAIKDRETGLLYEFGNISQLADKMLLLLMDQTLRDELAKNAHSWSKTFEWDVVASQTIDLLKDRLNKKG
ncbi:MAG: glycosyltransferase family 4 protein [Bacteroidota bacterium]|nr:glycosyltransferase family 4 protein [Bacteroidota bacterium]